MIEVERKAVVRDLSVLRAALSQLAPVERVTYRDVYFDRDAQFTFTGQELRIRQIGSSFGIRSVLTFKDSPTSPGVQREHETEIGDVSVIETVLKMAGFTPTVSFSKECENFRFEFHGYPILATVVSISELSDVFIEIETLLDDENGQSDALKAVESLCHELHIRARTSLMSCIRTRLRVPASRNCCLRLSRHITASQLATSGAR